VDKRDNSDGYTEIFARKLGSSRIGMLWQIITVM
jgi:hypothetical protein